MIVQMLKAIDNNSDATQEEKDVAKAKVDVEALKLKQRLIKQQRMMV